MSTENSGRTISGFRSSPLDSQLKNLNKNNTNQEKFIFIVVLLDFLVGIVCSGMQGKPIMCSIETRKVMLCSIKGDA